MEQKKISILGCGWFGLPFVQVLVQRGYHVSGSTTSEQKLTVLAAAGVTPYLINLNEDDALPKAFLQTDVLFICFPPKAKTEDATNYSTKVEKIKKAALGLAKRVVFISSTGVFEDGNFEMDETNTPKPSAVSSKALLDAENIWLNSEAKNATIIRFAGLIGPQRNLAKFFAGRLGIPNGNAPINLITLADCIGVCVTLIETEQFGGIYHAVVPHHPSRSEFYSRLCQVSEMQKPVFIDELKEWKIINSINVPRKLGYQYIVKDWFEWMTKEQL